MFEIECNFLILGPIQCSFCKYPKLYYFIKRQQKTYAGQTLYRTLCLYIYGGGHIYLDRDIEKPGICAHFSKRTGCTPWFFIMLASTKLNCAFNKSNPNSKFIFFNFSFFKGYLRNFHDLDYKCS